MSTKMVLPGVTLQPGETLGEFVILGHPFQEDHGTVVPTLIGPQAVLRSHTVIYAGNQIGARFRTGHGALIREHNRIGDDVSVGSHSIIEHHVEIGNRVRLHSNVFVPEYSVLEDDVWVGPGAVLTNARYPASRDAKRDLKGPRLCRASRVGAAVTLLPGVTIGANSLVGAGSVVVRNVPPDTVVAGNPAKVIRSIREIDAYRSDLSKLDRGSTCRRFRWWI
jgi:acetyltransferase-like isoleucine patch superfamily enzyme